MPRLSLAALLGVAAAGLIGLGATRAQDSKTPPPSKGAEHSQHYIECAKACDDCARACSACSAHCTRMVADGKKEHLDTLRACQDCATVCAAASAITARGGPYADAICLACADVCKRCGDACEKQAADPMMKQCAVECRKCEKACRDMLTHARAAR